MTEVLEMRIQFLDGYSTSVLLPNFLLCPNHSSGRGEIEERKLSWISCFNYVRDMQYRYDAFIKPNGNLPKRKKMSIPVANTCLSQ